MTAAAYDDVAELYADFARGALERIPLDKAVIAAFADYVRDAGPVADLGCGPGHNTAHLRGLGLDVSGLDLSPNLIALARTAYPGLRFEVGSMAALPFADGSLGGILSWYSMIHTPPAEVPGFFAEFFRTLAPGGHLLVGCFESGGEPISEFDHKVITAYRWPLDELAAVAAAAGFVEYGRMVREPTEGERFLHGRLFLRKP